MNGAGDQLFAGSRFTGDQDRTPRRRDQLDAPDQIQHRTGATDDTVRLNHRSTHSGQRDTITREHFVFSSKIRSDL
jgi:hypothetical protein